VRQAAAEIDDKLAAYLRGTLAVCLSMALYYAIALSLVGPLAGLMRGEAVAGMELAWAIGLLTGLLSFLPIIGASIGAFTMLAVALVQYQLQLWEPYALILGLFVIGQSLEGYVMTPMLVGNRVGLHPLWVIFALLAGGALGGILGMVAAIPVAVVVSVLLPRLMKFWRESLD
jgi:predicted PurR-regulated permease PerM